MYESPLAGQRPICIPVYPALDAVCFGLRDDLSEMPQFYVVHFFRETFASANRISGVPGIEYNKSYRMRWNSAAQRVEHTQYAIWLVPAWRCEKCHTVFIVAELEDLRHGCTERQDA